MSIYVNKRVSRFQPFAGYSECARESVSERIKVSFVIFCCFLSFHFHSQSIPFS